MSDKKVPPAVLPGVQAALEKMGARFSSLSGPKTRINLMLALDWVRKKVLKPE